MIRYWVKNGDLPSFTQNLMANLYSIERCIVIYTGGENNSNTKKHVTARRMVERLLRGRIADFSYYQITISKISILYYQY